jgi:DNA-binding response OmpR family regulator
VEDAATGWVAAGCTDSVTRPINAVELLAKVRGFIGAAG